MQISDIAIILVRPSESGNVGAVCRAMKNMGLSRLRIVSPEVPLDEGVIRSRAVHAADLWENALRFDTLEEALADCALVIGTTRRRGKQRKTFSINPRECAGVFKEHPGPAALLFGNERTGLEKEELLRCNMASHIPVSGEFPSLNLSHAVQIYAYELFLALGPAEEKRWVPLDQRNIEALARFMGDSLGSIGFYKQAGREEQERFFRDILSRSGISKKEGRYLQNIFVKIAALIRRNPYRPEP